MPVLLVGLFIYEVIWTSTGYLLLLMLFIDGLSICQDLRSGIVYFLDDLLDAGCQCLEVALGDGIELVGQSLVGIFLGLHICIAAL